LPRIIVVGLSYSTDEGTLRDAFSHYGEVVDGTSVLVLSLRSSWIAAFVMVFGFSFVLFS
jgi:RNA recognition motif-containing protein